YPEDVELGMAITKQEAWTKRGGLAVRVPDFVAEVIERVAFEARSDKRIDKRSGVSQRMPITVLENAVSNAERRAIEMGECEVVPRITDKMELEYEGELVGGHAIADELIRRAADAAFQSRAGGVNTDDIVMWFDRGNALQVGEDLGASAMVRAFERVPSIVELVRDTGLATQGDDAITAAACELTLEALVARKKLSRSASG